jgi:hypothetical protein
MRLLEAKIADAKESRERPQMKMTEQQKREWKAYRKECAITNVEPTVADFLGIEP